MSRALIRQIREAESALRRGQTDAARKLLAEIRRDASSLSADTSELSGAIARYEVMLSRTLQVTLAKGLEPVAEQILDGMTSIVGARRGFVGLLTEPGWRFIAARNIQQTDIDDPDAHVSTSIITEAVESGEPVVVHDAGQERAGQTSVHQLKLRSVVCLPLSDAGEVVGFVYLDNPQTQGIFDEAALAAVRAWLPVVAGCIGRALAEQAEQGPLTGVITRSAKMRAELSELSRVARFDVPILLTGETGTGKSLIARQIHNASGSAGPFIHVNCGAIPEALIEGELFGHIKGAFTGATADRTGKFQAAAGGTIFLDELDSLPMSCQVKLLVTLQERQVTPLGSNTPIALSARVIAAMGSDPFDAIDEGRLREDLYYRLAVFVANLPPLRSRMEDVPLLVSHFLSQTRTRYNLPPMRLTEDALETLLNHNWPGNVRELANTLDRAALLSSDGVIENVSFRSRRRGGAGAEGVIGTLEAAGKAMLAAMTADPGLRKLEVAEALRSVVLLQAVARDGRDDAFVFFDMAAQVKNRNHQRTLKREADRLSALAESLGESLSSELAALL
ncbi:MAG: transcriptional regulator with GAF, ATPase, and Fis domain [Myxococcota bacterium]|jgi:transcriptional regulator with GAF, ATPase, and Fis domain